MLILSTTEGNTNKLICTYKKKKKLAFYIDNIPSSRIKKKQCTNVSQQLELFIVCRCTK